METRELNRLKRGDQRRIEDWLLAHRDDIAKERLNHEMVLARATKELGLKLTVNNIRNSAKTVGVKMFNRPSSSNRKPKYESLAAFVCQLADKLGEPVPEFLRPRIHETNGKH